MTEQNDDHPALNWKKLGLVASLGAGFALAGQLACGGSDDANPCPTGNCTLPGSTLVKFSFNAYPDRGFPGGDTCIDLGIGKVRTTVVKADDALVTQSSDTECGNAQVTFVGLEPGTYHVELTPLDLSGNSLIKAPVPGQVEAAAEGMSSQVAINIPYDAWAGTYTGNFLFTIAWGGVTCAAALSSPIVTQRLKLTVNGAVATQSTDSGQKVDGTDPKPCHEFGPGKFEFVMALPFGPATLEVTGTDAASMTHAASFDTFVGIGISNPTLKFDVPTMPDAGIPDAPVDAVGDAAPDAP